MKIDYITVFTSKLEESITFYTKFLGFTLRKRVFVDGGVTLVFLDDGHGGNIELVENGQELPASQNSPVAITIIVESINEIDKRISNEGIVKTFGPVTMPSGVKLLHISDPNGVTINFVEMGDGEF